MSAIKRKHASGEKSRESVKKRPRHESGHSKDTDPTTTKRVPNPAKSVLTKEQPAFPRGGSGPLTLIERKQILGQASRDVARELDQGDLFTEKEHGAQDSDDSDLGLQDVDKEQTFAKRPSKNSKKSRPAKEGDGIPIESMSYRKLSAESLLLGRISAVSRRGLTVALPNNLSGFVPLTAISNQLNSTIERALQETSDDESSQNEEEDEADITQLFRVGQLLRVAVQSVTEEESTKKDHKNRIDLSIQPHQVNRGLEKHILAPNVTVQAAVVSVEDHGAIVDIGLTDGTTAFLPKKSLPPNYTLADLKPGTVLLCFVQKAISKGKVVQLSANLPGGKPATNVSSVDSLLPGTLVNVLLTQISEDGLVGKVIGLLDVSADTLHSAAFLDKTAFTEKYHIGEKVVGRLIANFPRSDSKKLAFSVLDQLLVLDHKIEDRLAISSVIDRAQVLSIVHGRGVYFSLPSGALGFAHVSRLSDRTIDALSATTGPYKVGTDHQARILEYNAVDGLYILSLQKSVIEQPFLRLEDIEAGMIATGTVDKIVLGVDGVRGLLVKLASSITGFVPALHLSDATLNHPEKKYREGMSVKSRVLNVDLDRRRLVLTLKKSLVNSDQPVWAKWSDLEVSDSAIGTLIKVEADHAIVQFYGPIKGRLPVSEMSEAYIRDAREHFKVGQVLTVHVLRVDPERRRLVLSARDPSTEVTKEPTNLIPASLVTGTVFEKSSDDILLRIEPSGAIARLSLDHVSDGSLNKRKSALEKIRVGQKLENVLVLEVKGRKVTLSNKASLRKAAEEGKLLKSFEDLAEDAIFTGFVSNITEHKVFVRFAQGITAVMNAAQIPEEQAQQPDFGMKLLQPVSARVIHIDYKGASPRFWLSMKTRTVTEREYDPAATHPVGDREIIDPVDEQITTYADLKVGSVIKVKITSVRETQLNVLIARDLQGRVDVSEVYDKIEDIVDRKSPLSQFSNKQTITVKILGQHDSRTYKFLPLSHRNSKHAVFELSARPSVISSKNPTVLKLEDIKVGDQHMAFVNNISEHSLMVNISPAVRGRISDRDVSDDLDVAANLGHNFPVGAVLLATVRSVDVEKNRLDLSAKTGASPKVLTIENISAGDIVAGRVTKITDHSVVVQLSEDLVGVVELIDMADDYNLSDPARLYKGEIVRAYVLQVDQPNKKIYLSLRPSKILSSSLAVEDPPLSLQTVNVGDVVRGFVTNVSDKGVFVTLARGLTALVRVTNLSDEYLKEWKNLFQRDQLVRGKIIFVDKDSGHIHMSLRESHITGVYKAKLTFNDLKVGDTVEARIAKVESFGVFIVVKNSENVRGLCHRSEIADKRIQDATKLGFSEGDTVKAKVLKVEPDQRRINFGMKASYFDEADAESGNDSDAEISDVEDSDEDAVSDDDGVALDDALDLQDGMSLDEDGAGVSVDPEKDAMEADQQQAPSKSLSLGGFDWFGMPTSSKPPEQRPAEELDEDKSVKPKKKKKKPEILVDRTGDLDNDGPQSVDDFERLLLSEPDNAERWIQFMAFYIDLGDTDAAREVADKALRTIGLAQEDQKRAIWIARFNIELTFGDDESLEAVLQQSCETMDPEDMHTKLASICIQSGKYDKADHLFQTITKKFTQNPKLWVNYATFLFDQVEDPARARALLLRALQALPPFTHFEITKQFACLEFKTKTGVPEEGRTRFQGLINLYPKRLDLFNVMLDLEMRLGDVDQVRGVFEQALSKNLKPAKAKPFFKKWLEFEQQNGDERKMEEVKERAAKWVAMHKSEHEA